jgi:4,5-DOPA dioxygenase extradiol
MRVPVIFAGHGSPMNAIEDNRWSRGFAALADDLPMPRAILAISAHWWVDGTLLTADEHPKSIHDFHGFPEALYEISYPAPGDAALAGHVAQLLDSTGAALSTDWGLDHGTWSVLRWMYPEADVPVVQLSMDRRLAPAEHFEIGQRLAPLRDEGVLVFGSGNIVHNLRDAFARMRADNHETPDWAGRYDETVREALAQHDHDALVAAWPGSEDGRRSHPTPDHWLPLLYCAGASHGGGAVRFPVEGFDWGSLSMRCVRFG